VAAVAVASHFAWHQGAGEMNATNLGKVGYGWMTWEMLEARVAGAKFSDV